MNRSQDISALIARVEEATGPDRELDAVITRALLGYEVPGHPGKWGLLDDPTQPLCFGRRPEPMSEIMRQRKEADGAEVIDFHEDDGWSLFVARVVPRLTASLDAALALAKRSGFYIRSEPRFHIDGERVDFISYALRPRWSDWCPDDEWFDRGEAKHADQVLSALLALLKALHSQTEGGDDAAK